MRCRRIRPQRVRMNAGSGYTTGFFTGRAAHDKVALRMRAEPGKEKDMIISQTVLSYHGYNVFRQSGLHFSDRLFAHSYKANRDHVGIL